MAILIKSRSSKITVFVCIVTAIILGCYLHWIWYENDGKYNNSSAFNNIFNWNQNKDFNQLREKYPDIIAWLEVPNTNVNLAVVQHPSDDYYYLSHAPTGQQDMFGAAYIELCNKNDFSDPVTLIYGHNMLDDSMFATLHSFEDTQFFQENEYFYIYTPGHKYTYTIISAYTYDNRHIINTNKGFQNKDTLMKYYETVKNPSGFLKNVRNGVSLSEDDKIVQLSTCMSDIKLSNQRYLVTGVLTEDQELN